jgi:hypothetical protein
MIAALLTRHRVLSLRELIAALAREFGWKFTEGNVTDAEYLRRREEPQLGRRWQFRSASWRPLRAKTFTLLIALASDKTTEPLTII